MERVRGIILRREPPQGLDLSPEWAQRLGLALIDGLADLHRLDYRAAGLGDLGKPEGYVQRQVSGWTQRYYGSQTDELPDVDRVTAWLKDKMPPESGAALVHNDYKFDNLVLDPADPTRIIGVLDWEMATIGDPLMDLGTTLGYWAEAGDPEDLQQFRLGPTTLPGMPTRRELAERYAGRTGADLSLLPFYHVFALFKIAVIVQQIYYRYARGLTQDRRFAPLIHMVRVLNREAIRVAEASGW